MPGLDGLAPLEKWHRVKFHNFEHLYRLHSWGCPVYVLDARLQDGNRIPKYQPRSRQGIFSGFLKEYASNVSLIINPSTKRISPQYHVIFDDFFQTMRSVTDASDSVLNYFDWDFLITPQGIEEYVDPVERNKVPAVHPE